MQAPIYTKEYKTVLSTVFGYDREFVGALGELQIVDGIRHNATAFTVKTNNTPVVIGATYDKGANVAFGTGTGKSSRFGERQEVIYTDTDVPYNYELVIHEGLDVATVNNDFEEALMDRMFLQGEANVLEMNEKHGAALSANAGSTEPLADLTEASILALFNKVSADFTNKRVRVAKYAYVKPELYNAIVDLGIASTAKNSSVNIDDNEILKFKGFLVVETPEDNFVGDDVAYFAAEGVLVPFIGIEIYRAIESEDFAGVALQSYSKGGTFVLDDNKDAIVKVTLSVTP